GIKNRLHALVDGVLRPAGDDRLVRLAGELVLFFYLLADRGEQLRDAIARGVMCLAPVQGVDAGIPDVFRGIEIRLSDREADDVDPLPLHLLCPVGDLNSSGGGDPRNLLRERPHCNRLTSFTADSTARFA